MTAADPAFVYLVTAGVIVVTLIIISLVCSGKSSEKKNDGVREARRAPAAGREENVPAGGRGRRRPARRNRMQIDEHDWDMNMQQEPDQSPVSSAASPSSSPNQSQQPSSFQPTGPQASPEADGPPDVGYGDDEDEDGMMDDINLPEGKVGAKKLKKLQEKAEKKRNREFELQEREEKKEREKKSEEQRKRDEEKRKAEEAIEAEEARLRKEEKERQEHEEYLKLKAAFTVDEEGESEQTTELDAQSLLQQFIDHIKEMKVVMLEDLAAHFKLRTQDCINRINDLQADGRLTGVIDDRGKFIYITMEELEAVAKYMRNIGRVSISELAESSNRLINLNPDNAEIQKKLIVGEDVNTMVEVASQ